MNERKNKQVLIRLIATVKNEVIVEAGLRRSFDKEGGVQLGNQNRYAELERERGVLCER